MLNCAKHHFLSSAERDSLSLFLCLPNNLREWSAFEILADLKFEQIKFQIGVLL